VNFSSILFLGDDPARVEPGADPPFFVDLNLDQVIDAVLGGREAYDLRPFFRTPLRTVDSVLYRHEIFHDLEQGAAFEAVSTFAASMRVIRDALNATAKLSYTHERERWVVDASSRYCEAVRDLLDELQRLPIASRGLLAFRAFLADYQRSDDFRNLAADIDRICKRLASITYAVLIDGNRFTVRDPSGEGNLVTAIHETFARFRYGAAKSYLLKFPERLGMNGIEAKVLEFVALLHPDVFDELDRFAAEHADFIDPVVGQFDREVQFYLSYIEYVRRFEAAGLPTCYPSVSIDDKTVRADDAFDVALARRLIEADEKVVSNSFELHGDERVFVVSGPNQGGKTTFARTFGQLHYLAALGCRVAGRAATAHLFDAIFTHFERQEDPLALRGKLEDDIIRVHDILEQATSNSVIILNEIFASTTVRDAGVLARRVLDRILELDALCVCVTFIDELSTISEKTVSVVSLVDPANLNVRTYKLARRPADGLAYAVSLAEKYSLTYEQLRARLGAGKG